MEGSQRKVYYCPVEVTLDLIGGRWKPLILWHLKEREVLRHGQFQRLIPTITQKMLTQQLRQLEADGLVRRTQYAEVPPRFEYSLTEYGRELQSMLNSFCGWGLEHARRAGIMITNPASARPVRTAEPHAGPAGASGTGTRPRARREQPAALP